MWRCNRRVGSKRARRSVSRARRDAVPRHTSYDAHARMQHQELLAHLRATPALLARALESFPQAVVRTPPRNEGFSMVENLWHMADLEREGYGQRIARILAEERPCLPDFAGDRIARERDYKKKDPSAGLTAFTDARQDNLARLASLTVTQWVRSGTQEEVGEVSLSDVARMMLEHDQSHLDEIAALVAELDGTKRERAD